MTGTRQCRHNDHMDRHLVGARELKTRLGTYLRHVRQGRTLIVTDRGEPMAELRPLTSKTGAAAVLAKLAVVGAITPPVRASMRPFRPIQSHGRAASDAVREDRDDRF